VAEIVAVYEYHDEQDVLVYASVRFEPKAFRQGRPDGTGGLIWDMTGVRRVPYRLPDVIAAARAGQAVFVCEGEKDVDRLVSLGLTATTNAGGAGKWPPEFGEYLRGAHVVILPDNDGPGREHAQTVARSVHDVAASIKVVELPGLPAKGDVSDWLDAGHDVQELFAVARAASGWSPNAVEQWRKRQEQLRRKLARSRAKRKQEHERVTDDQEWRRRVDRAKAIPIAQIAVMLGLGTPQGNGKRRFVRCPFHQDEHPSLGLLDGENVWYCHPCGEGGTAIGLYERVKGVGFADAVQQLTTGR